MRIAYCLLFTICLVNKDSHSL